MPNVVEFLRSFRGRSKVPKPPELSAVVAEGVLSMSATEFRDANLAVLVRSYLLGEDIVLASNDRCRVLYGHKYVTYLPEELMAVYQLSPDFVKRIHHIKKLCDGEILAEGVL
ncbi:MAG: hypothetical protein ABII79_05880 [bacterium]